MAHIHSAHSSAPASPVNVSSDWQPHPEGMDTLLSILVSTQNPTDNAAHKEATEKLKQMASFPEYPCYLTYAFVHQNDPTIRSVAGLVLKSVCKKCGTFAPSILEYVKSSIIGVLADEAKFIRQTAANCVSTIAFYGDGPENWPVLLHSLPEALDSNNPNLIDGALMCIKELFEDCPEKFSDAEYLPIPNPVERLIPQLIRFFQHDSADWKTCALVALNELVEFEPPQLYAHIEGYLKGVFQLAMDSSSAVRKNVIIGFSRMLRTRVDLLMPYMTSIMEYIMISLDDSEDEVRIEATYFITNLCHTHEMDYVVEILDPLVPRFVPLLLKALVYDEMELFSFPTEEELHESIPDRPEEIRPFHTQTRGDDNEEDDGRYETPENYNLRKCSGACLEMVATCLQEQGSFLDQTISMVSTMLKPDQEWQIVESAVLAIGAIADGVWRSLDSHLPDLMNYLFAVLSGQIPSHFLVKSISCWTISRFAPWTLSKLPEDSSYLENLLKSLLLRISTDTNKKVQHAACSAFAVVEEQARNELDRYVGVILEHLCKALEKYQKKNMFIIYDALGTLAESVGETITLAEHQNTLMSALYAKWSANSGIDDVTFPPLLSCLTCVAMAMQDKFIPFFEPFLEGSLNVIGETVHRIQHASAGGASETVDRKALICAMDLVSAMVDGFARLSRPFCEKVSHSNLIQLMQVAQLDKKDLVRQSTFALLGDLIVNFPELMASDTGGHGKVVELFLPALMKNLRTDWIPVCINCIWVFGELCVWLPDSAIDIAVDFFERVIPMLKNMSELPFGIVENAAISIGRLARIAPALIAGRIGEIIEEWTTVMADVRSRVERESAFDGLCRIAETEQTHSCLLPFINNVISAFMRCRYASQDLQTRMRRIVAWYKSDLGNEWDRLYHEFPPWFQMEFNQKFPGI